MASIELLGPADGNAATAPVLAPNAAPAQPPHQAAPVADGSSVKARPSEGPVSARTSIELLAAGGAVGRDEGERAVMHE